MCVFLQRSSPLLLGCKCLYLYRPSQTPAPLPLCRSPTWSDWISPRWRSAARVSSFLADTLLSEDEQTRLWDAALVWMVFSSCERLSPVDCQTPAPVCSGKVWLCLGFDHCLSSTATTHLHQYHASLNIYTYIFIIYWYVNVSFFSVSLVRHDKHEADKE